MTDKNTFLSGFLAGRKLRTGARSAQVSVSDADRRMFFNGLAAGLAESDVSPGHLTDFWEWVRSYSEGSFPTSWEDFQDVKEQIVSDFSSSTESGTTTQSVGAFIVNNDVPFVYPANRAAAAVDKRSSFNTTVVNEQKGGWSLESIAAEDVPKSPSWKSMCATIASQPFTLRAGTAQISITDASWESDEFSFYHSQSISIFHKVDGQYVYIGGFELRSNKLSLSISPNWEDAPVLEDCIFVPFIAAGTYYPLDAGSIITAHSGPATVVNNWSFVKAPRLHLKSGPLTESLSDNTPWGEQLLRFDVPGERIGKYYDPRTSQYESIRSIAFSYSADKPSFIYTISSDVSGYITTITFLPWSVVIQTRRTSGGNGWSKTLYYAGRANTLPHGVNLFFGAIGAVTVRSTDVEIEQDIENGTQVTYPNGESEVIGPHTGIYSLSRSHDALRISWDDDNSVQLHSCTLVDFIDDGGIHIADSQTAGHLLGLATAIEYSSLSEILPHEFSCMIKEGGSIFSGQDMSLLYPGGPLTRLIVHYAPERMSVGDGAFRSLVHLEQIDMNTQFTDVGDYAFYRCTHLRGTVRLASGVSLGRSAFAGCAMLDALVLPKYIRSIASGALSGCAGFSRMFICENTALYTSTDGTANNWNLMLGGAPDLEDISISPYRDDYKSVDGVVFSKDGSVLYYYPRGRKNQEYSIPDGVTKIAKSAFSGSRYLKSVTISPGVTHIESAAFEAAVALERVRFSATSVSIASSAFYDCTALTEVDLPANLTEIASSVFRGCKSLQRVGLPDGLGIINGYAFYGCVSLTSVSLPASLQKIGSYAFSDCPLAGNIELSVPVINTRAFYGSRFSRVWIRSTVEQLDAYAFATGRSNKILYAEPDEKPAGWADTYCRKSTSSSTNYPVTYGQTTQPW